jgi:hypothetical protein
MNSVVCFLTIFLISQCATRRIIFNGTANDSSSPTAWRNGALFNQTMAKLLPGDIFIVPNRTYYTLGGIVVSNIKNVVIQIDGTIIFSNNTVDIDNWPANAQRNVFECFYFVNFYNVTFTSSKRGVLNGNGAIWWGIPYIGINIC